MKSFLERMLKRGYGRPPGYGRSHWRKIAREQELDQFRVLLRDGIVVREVTGAQLARRIEAFSENP